MAATTPAFAAMGALAIASRIRSMAVYLFAGAAGAEAPGV